MGLGEEGGGCCRRRKGLQERDERKERFSRVFDAQEWFLCLCSPECRCEGEGLVGIWNRLETPPREPKWGLLYSQLYAPI